MRLAPLSLVLVCVAATGCEGPRPYVHEGDASHVQVRHGGRPDTTLAVAREYCARYEREPRQVSIEPDLVLYDCVRR